MKAIEAAGGCPQSSIHALRDGSITRGILFDATLLPGKATADGWLEPGTPVTWANLEALEEIEGVRVRKRGDCTATSSCSPPRRSGSNRAWVRRSTRLQRFDPSTRPRRTLLRMSGSVSGEAHDERGGI